MNRRIALVDGDMLPYKIGYVAGKSKINLEDTKKMVDVYLSNIFAEVKATHYIIFLSGKNNFRIKVSKIKVYKGNRSKEKPPYFQEIKDYLKEKYNTYYVNGAEADDALTVYQTYYGTEGIICSDDKDLLQKAGEHFNIRTRKTTMIDEVEAHYRIFHQLLTGDSTDNIRGIEGIGPATAKKILEAVRPENYRLECLQQYVKKYDDIGVEYCKETFKLIYMMRIFKNIILPLPEKIK